ncbi:hypothetical protein PtA15_13A485 [Puccinia triticina]|uniref:Uncharacterized protein n=1 Tax=Puccinia triticina TaxID=208348 RepID=A0ABY7D0J2_9BASI|nr:uncharacterized protein PtA15_13A485 [Puccinia triticina]WAQ91084.1 hypothetical protein PtA15_13A485 [Puccinia triticina]
MNGLSFAFIFFTTLTIVKAAHLWLNHEVVIESRVIDAQEAVDEPAAIDAPFSHPGHEKAHVVGKYDFYTRIQVDPDGAIYANNPFPCGCWYRITQDSHQLKQHYFQTSTPSGDFIGTLNRKSGKKTLIEISYYLNANQVDTIVNHLAIGPPGLKAAFIRPMHERLLLEPASSIREPQIQPTGKQSQGSNVPQEDLPSASKPLQNLAKAKSMPISLC